MIKRIQNIEQLEKLLANQKKNILRSVSPFKKDTAARQKRRINKARRNRFYFYKTYLPHYFSEESNWHHEEMDHHAELRKGTIVAIAGARETGKTVQMAVGYPLHQALFEKRNFIMFIADTQDLSVERMIAIRAELESNPRIRHDFGKLENPGLWEMDDFTTRSGVRFTAIGYKMSPRGKISGPNRPDLIIFEDFENKQTARNEKISREKKEYVLEEAYPAMIANGSLLWLGNLPGKKCAMQQFRDETEQGDFTGLRFFLFYPVEFADGTLLWPEIKTRKWCDKKKNTIGTLAYEREYKLNPVVEGRIFRDEWFRQLSEGKITRSIIWIDPGFGKSKHACKKAIVLLGWGDTKYKTPDAWIRLSTVTAMIEAIYAMWERWKNRDVGLMTIYCEDNFAQLDRLKHDIDAAAKKHGYRLPIIPFTTKENKDAKIESCAGIIERGDAEFDLENPDVRELRDQFVYFPDHPHKDGPDAWASAKSKLDTAKADFSIMSVVTRTFKRQRFNE